MTSLISTETNIKGKGSKKQNSNIKTLTYETPKISCILTEVSKNETYHESLTPRPNIFNVFISIINIFFIKIIYLVRRIF